MESDHSNKETFVKHLLYTKHCIRGWKIKTYAVVLHVELIPPQSPTKDRKQF